MRKNRRSRSRPLRVFLLAAFSLLAFAAFAYAGGESDLEKAARLASSEDSSERLEALGLLAELANSSGFALIAGLTSDEAPEVRRLAVQALGETGNASAVEIITPFFSDNSEDMRVEVARALGKIDSPDALAALHARMFRAGGRELTAVTLAAAAHGSVSTIPKLVSFLRDRPSGIKRTAEKALERITGLAFEDSKAWERWYRTRARLGKRGWLEDALARGDTSNRSRAAAELARMGGGESVPALIRALEDEKSGVRERAASALVSITGLDLGFDPDASAEERAKKTAKWREWWRRNRDADRREWLVRALATMDTANRRRAATELEGHESRESALALIRALEDSSPGVREAAAVTLSRFAGDDFGYDPDGTVAERRQAAGMFLEWARIKYE